MIAATVSITWPIALQFALWSLFAAVWLALMPKARKDGNFVRRSNYNGSLYITISISLLLWLLGLGNLERILPFQAQGGVILTAIGLGVAIHARFVLGHYWDIHAAGRKDGVFLETFPYNIVRHPIYGAQLIMCLGTALTAHNLGVYAVLVGGSYALLRHRARHEEGLLNELTGGAYGECFAGKGRFFPRIGRVKRG